MDTLKALLPHIQIVLSVLLIAAILLQQTGSGIGGAFGESNNFGTTFHTRRGLEKFLFNGTIVLAILFGLSALIALK
ncbi:MAG: preprotein translocase subunit SecG [Patescibacteria group bacterium]